MYSLGPLGITTLYYKSSFNTVKNPFAKKSSLKIPNYSRELWIDNNIPFPTTSEGLLSYVSKKKNLLDEEWVIINK